MIKHLLLLMMVFFCQNVMSLEQKKSVVILFSDDNQSYHAPAQAFKEKQENPVIVYNLEGDVDKAPAVMSRIMRQNPALIFALGAKAAWFAKAATRDHLETKVVFAMVINWKRYHLLDGQTNIIGISSDIAPGTQLFNLSLVSPQVKRVGVIYSKSYSQEIIKQAENAASLLGLKLISQPLTDDQLFKRAWRSISDDIDAYWVLSDPVLYTMENVFWLNDRCIKEKIVCMGQSSNIAKLGVLLSINPDEENLGSQAAALAKRIMDKNSKNVMNKINDPIATKVTLNKQTAQKIGIKISDQVLSLVNEVIK